jgi:DNA-binding PadR family transcriptional regulator
MCEEGFTKKLPDNKYELTPKGRKEIEWPKRLHAEEPRTVEDVLEQMSGYVSYLEDLSKTQSVKVFANSPELKNLRERLARLGGE